MKKIRFLCFGDSLTAGWPGYYPASDGVTLGTGNVQSQYEYWLKRYCVEFTVKECGIDERKASKRFQFINKGVPGDTSTGLLSRIQDLIDYHPKPDYSIIIIGTNDLGWSQSQESIFRKIKQLHQLSREHKIYSIGGVIPPTSKNASIGGWGTLRAEFNDALRDYFNRQEIPYTEYTEMVDSDGYLKPSYTSGDGVHFSVEGYKKMGLSLFKNVVKSLLKDNPNRT